MSKRIRRTVIITITDTVTILWPTGDAPARDSSASAPQPASSEEECHDMLQAPVNDADPGPASPSEPSATPPTLAAETEPQSKDVPTRATTGSRRKRRHRRRTEDDEQSQ